MLHKLSCCKTQKKSINLSNISLEEKELYSYGLKILIQWVITITVIILIGIFTEMISECLLMLLSFMLVRKFSGGIHLKKYFLCLLSSGVIILCGLYLIKHRWFVDLWLFKLIILFATILLSLISPVIHPNKNINAHESKIYHFVTIVLTTSFTALTILLTEFPRLIHLGYSIGTGIILCSLLTLVGKVKYQKSKRSFQS